MNKKEIRNKIKARKRKVWFRKNVPEIIKFSLLGFVLGISIGLLF